MSYQHPNDKEILDAIQSSDRGNQEFGLKALFEKYFNLIEDFVCKNSGNYDEANDIAQEAAIALYENVRKTGFELKCALQTYLYSIARNLWLKELKRKGKTKMVIDTTKDYLELEIADEFEYSKVEEYLIQECMKHLNTLFGKRCKEVLTYVFWHNWSMAQIANAMGYASARVAANRKFDCMAELRNRMRVLRDNLNR